MEKHLIMFPIPHPYRKELCRLMDRVASETGIPAPHMKLPPHVTFHRPLEGISETTLQKLITSTTLRMRQTRITVNSLFPFGKHYIVLPVQATRSVAALWVGINNLLSRLPEYEHGEYDDDNTLHITVAAKTSAVFDTAWPTIQKIHVKPMVIPLRTIVLCRKTEGGEKWETMQKFHIPL